MKINVKVLQDYLKKVSLNATILTLNLDFEKTGVTTQISDTGNTCMTKGLLRKDAFVDYDAIGELFIKNSKFFIDILGTFKDEVNLVKIDTNTLNLYTSNREVYILLAEESHDMPLKHSLTITMNKSDLDRIVKDMTILDIKSVQLKKDNDKNISIQVGKKNEYDFTITNIECNSKEKFKVGIGANLVPFAQVVGPTFTVSVANNYPLLFKDDNQLMYVETIMAPFIEDD
jgi:hypothetical protein